MAHKMAADLIGLYEALEGALVSCPADLGGGSYLPQSVLNGYVREPLVTALLKEEQVPKDLWPTIATSAPKILIILLLANKVDRIKDVLECGLRDQDLPLTLGGDKISLVSCRGTVFRPFSSSSPSQNRRDVQEIHDKQYMVDPPILDDSGEHRTFDAKRVLPFLQELEPLGSGGKDVFDCTIHPGYFRAVDNHDDHVVADVRYPLPPSRGCCVTTAYPGSSVNTYSSPASGNGMPSSRQEIHKQGSF